MEELNKWFKCKIEHMVNTELHYFEIPETPFNSFTMALAHFERQALSYPECGIIVKVEVIWVKTLKVGCKIISPAAGSVIDIYPQTTLSNL